MQDAAVSGRVRQFCREHAHKALFCSNTQWLQRGFLYQRYIAVHHQHHMVIRDARHGLCYSVSGSELFSLQHPVNPGIGKCRAHQLCAMPDHHVYCICSQSMRTGNDVPEQRLPAQRMQYLRQTGTHACSLTGGKYDNTEAHELIFMVRNTCSYRPGTGKLECPGS